MRGGDSVLFCSMLSESGQFWPFIVGAMLTGAQLSCADAHRRRSGARRDVRAPRPVPGGAGYHRRHPRRTRRARPLVCRHVRHDRHRRRPPECVRARLEDAGLSPHHFVVCGPAIAIGQGPGTPPGPRGQVAARRGPDRRSRARHQSPRREFVRRPTAAYGTKVYGTRPGVPREAVVTQRALISADNHVFEPPTLWQERLPVELPPRAALDSNSAATGTSWPSRACPTASSRPTGAVRQARERKASHELGLRAGGADPDAARARHGARRGRRRSHLSDVRPLHRHDPRARPADGVRAGLQRLVRRIVPAPARCIHSVCDRAGPRVGRPPRSRRWTSSFGFQAATIPTTPPAGTPYNDPAFDPLWKLAARSPRPSRCTRAPVRCRNTTTRPGRGSHRLREGGSPLR